ncbi:uncharacterized protein B0I36DRAFT_330704 [Microdochium trichocladiopsis]|uniref:F-box domain-containing protein n=1 Tax=Microdochium trichocladiopsis TaxID=1682393 RepID=A0A9P8Y0C2_9PEZI|nr:uncharacterized protein B0I36DRAFT_330704 [Microdochium trichocladiopsis]KAH7026464.1 hypothetical protein B0I36DRAFT_330704 [Microdochium trichocladiopsis]
MDRLPAEIILSILQYCIANHYGDKNSLLGMRRVCKLFDDVLRTSTLMTLQLEFTRLDKLGRSRRPPDERALERIGHLCRALYLDMMVIRDDGEVRFLGRIFHKVPAMEPFVTKLRTRYCMNDSSFTEVEYREHLGTLLRHTTNMTATRLNLPFQLISRHCHAATMIMGNTFEALAQRDWEVAKPLETLVIENLTDTTVVKLWHNPRDVKNIIDVFRHLKHLLLSVRRHEEGHVHTIAFRNRLWEMIGKAPSLESLCLIGLDLDDRPFEVVKTSSQSSLSLEEWQFRSIPTIRKPPKSALPHLAYLELRRVEVMGFGLLSMLRCFSGSLKELYLDQVYLKTIHHPEPPPEPDSTLWIGLPNVRPPQNHRWIAVQIRQMRSQLRVCRASSLGYDQYTMGQGRQNPAYYDFDDPCGLYRTFEQRFVEVAMGVKQPPHAVTDEPVAYLPEEETQAWAVAEDERPAEMQRASWDAVEYLAHHNPTSIWQKAIDCNFPNCNQFTLDELHHMADTACEGMNEVNKLRHEDEGLGWFTGQAEDYNSEGA